MKKFENLGKVLSKEEQKRIMGGDPPGPLDCGNGCLPQIPDKCPSTCACAQQIPGVYKCLITS